MSDFFQELNKAKQATVLNAEKKRAIRNELISFINTHPVKKGIKQSWLKNIEIFVGSYKVVFSSALAALVILLGAGTSYAAQGSLPGDLLYPVKIHVNEPIQTALILDETKKVNFEIAKAEIRMAEADALAASGKLDDNKRQQIQTNLDKSAGKINNFIAQLSGKGETEKAAEVAGSFEASLQVHSGVMLALQDNHKQKGNSNSERDASNFGSNLDSVMKNVGKQRTDLDKKVSNDTKEASLALSAEAKLSSVKNTLDEVTNYIKENKSKAKDGSSAAEEQLAVAVGIYEEASSEYKNNNFKEVITLANKAARAAAGAKVLLKVETKLPVQINLKNKAEKDRNHTVEKDRNSKERNFEDLKREDFKNREDKQEDRELPLPLPLRINF